MAKTLKELATDKKKALIIIGIALFLFLIGRSFYNTYKTEEEKWKKRQVVEKEKKIEITDRSLYDLDQTAAIRNEVKKVESELLVKIEESKKTNEQLSLDIEKNQEIIKQQQEQYLALKSITDNEAKKNELLVEKEIIELKNQLVETNKQLSKMKKEKDIKAEMDSIEPTLPELNGPLAKALDKNPSTVSIDGPKLADLPVEPKNSFFDFDKPQQTAPLEATKDSKDTKKSKSDNKEEDEKNLGPQMDLMMGLVDATLVMGVDAPTNIGTKNSDAKDPLPVLLSVSSEALIANNYRQDYKNCLILASATGNATTERAYLRLSQLSCVSKNGEKRIEADIEGWVVGEDNKTGVSGHLVTKSGTLILKGLMAGIAQGLAEAASNTDNYITTTQPMQNGQYATTSMAEGFGSGAGSAFKTLADFYIEMAKDLYPVIEVKGGRKVQILMKGSSTKKPIREVPYNKMFVNTDYELEVNEKFSIEY